MVPMASRAPRETAPVPRFFPVAAEYCAALCRCRDSAAVGTLPLSGLCRCRDSAAVGDWSGSWNKRSRTTKTSHGRSPFSAQPPFSTLFPVVRPFADWVAPSPLSQHNSPPPFSNSYSPIHELILLMSRQCSNPGPSYPCPVWLRPYIKSKYSYNCSNC